MAIENKPKFAFLKPYSEIVFFLDSGKTMKEGFYTSKFELSIKIVEKISFNPKIKKQRKKIVLFDDKILGELGLRKLLKLKNSLSPSDKISDLLSLSKHIGRIEENLYILISDFKGRGVEKLVEKSRKKQNIFFITVTDSFLENIKKIPVKFRLKSEEAQISSSQRFLKYLDEYYANLKEELEKAGINSFFIKENDLNWF